MRTIEFRGKRIDTREWIYGNVFMINDTSNGEIISCIVPIPDYYPGDFIFDEWINDFIVDSETVGQYTGIKDLEGNKIFEGDIVSASNSSLEITTTSEVKFQDGTFSLGRYWKDGEHDWYSMEQYDSFEMCVIGNIIDNPELI